MRRIVLNVVCLLLFAGTIEGVGLGLRALGLDHTLSWVLGIIAGAFVMAAMNISGVYPRPWRIQPRTNELDGN